MTNAGFFGSSLVNGRGLPDPSRRFSASVSTALGWREVNYGIDSSTASGWRHDGDVLPQSGVARVRGILEAPPDVVIVLFGGMDYEKSVMISERRVGLGGDSVTPGRFVERHSAGAKQISFDGPTVAPLVNGGVGMPGTFAGDYDAILGALLENMSTDRIYAVTPPYRTGAETPNAIGHTLEDYCLAIRRVATGRDVNVLDAYSQSSIQPSNRDALWRNGYDLNEEGHQRLAAFIIQEIHGSANLRR